MNEWADRPQIDRKNCWLFFSISVTLPAQILSLCLPMITSCINQPFFHVGIYAFQTFQGDKYLGMILAVKNLESRHHASVVRVRLLSRKDFNKTDQIF